MKIGDVIRLRVDRRHLYPMSSGGTLNAHSLVGPVEWLTFEVRRLLPPLPGASIYPATELRLEGVSRSVAQGFIAADVEEYRHYYCLDCTEITDGDEDGFCLKCGSDNIVGYTDEEAREWAGLSKESQ